MSKNGTIHIDQALTNLSVAYSNGLYIAERVFLPVPVDHQSDKYFVYGKDLFRVRDDRRAPGAEAQESKWKLSNDTYFAEGHALKDYVPRENQGNADPQLDLMADTTQNLTDQVLLAQESNLVATLDAGMTGASVSDLTAKPWNNDANDPVAAIREQRIVIAKATGKFPNVLALGPEVWNAIQGNAKVIGRITGAGDLTATKITPQQFAALIEVDEVIVGTAVYDTANDGQAANLAFVWGDRALLFYRPPAPGRKTLALGYTFTWRLAGTAFGEPGVQSQFVNRYFWQPNLSDVVEVHKYYDQKIVDRGCGVLFKKCLG
jgi:hypothetical protein